jgi:hypothetical protein
LSTRRRSARFRRCILCSNNPTGRTSPKTLNFRQAILVQTFTGWTWTFPVPFRIVAITSLVSQIRRVASRTNQGIELMSNVSDELEDRGFLQQVSHDALQRELLSQRLTVYAGFDPTASSLHVGHLLPIMALAHFLKARSPATRCRGRRYRNGWRSEWTKDEAPSGIC